MKDAKLLLELLTISIPPGNKQRHNLTVEDDKLILHLICGDLCHPFELEDADFDKPVAQLAEEIRSQMVKAGYLEEAKQEWR